MRRPSILLLLTAALFSTALAPDARAIGKFPCDAYAKEALAAAKAVREHACGFDLNHPQWSTERHVHAGWCLTSNKASVDHETKERRDQVTRCLACRGYADNAVNVVDGMLKSPRCVDYIKDSRDDPRFSPKATDHFEWCMGLRSDAQYEALKSERDSRTRTAESCTLFDPLKQGVTKQAPPRAVPFTPVPATVNRAATNPNDNARRSSSSADTLRKKNASEPCKPGQPDDPCKPKAKLPPPGLLENNQATNPQTPSATGVPIAPPSGSTGVDTLRLR